MYLGENDDDDNDDDDDSRPLDGVDRGLSIRWQQPRRGPNDRGRFRRYVPGTIKFALLTASSVCQTSCRIAVGRLLFRAGLAAHAPIAIASVRGAFARHPGEHAKPKSLALGPCRRHNAIVINKNITTSRSSAITCTRENLNLAELVVLPYSLNTIFVTKKRLLFSPSSIFIA